MKESRRRAVRFSLLPLLLLAIAVLVGSLWFARPETLPPPSQEPSASVGSSSPPVEVAPAQPDLNGYEYMVSEERYVIRQDSGELEVQQRRRESWRAADGWAWARQTGSDPGKFVLKPYTEWELITRGRADATALEKVLRKIVGGVAASKIDNAEFNFVADMFAVATLPAGSLPKAYRKAIVGALARNHSVTVTRHVRDPLGRNSTRLSFTDADYRSDLTQSIYLDGEYQYLAYAAAVRDSDESGSRIVTERRRVDRIPEDLLAITGSERVEKAMWD